MSVGTTQWFQSAEINHCQVYTRKKTTVCIVSHVMNLSPPMSPWRTFWNIHTAKETEGGSWFVCLYNTFKKVTELLSSWWSFRFFVIYRFIRIMNNACTFALFSAIIHWGTAGSTCRMVNRLAIELDGRGLICELGHLQTSYMVHELSADWNHCVVPTDISSARYLYIGGTQQVTLVWRRLSITVYQ